VTAEGYRVWAVVCVRDKVVKQAWCLASSVAGAKARALINLYAKRWSIECGLRDTKDLRFGMGMGAIHVATPERRDRLWLLDAFAVALPTLLGAAGEAVGYDRLAQVEHHQAAHPLAIASRLHDLPAHSQHAGKMAPPHNRKVRRPPRRGANLLAHLRRHLK
jgi:hypothetical protein